MTRPNFDAIIAYYDETRWDYSQLWFKRNRREIHFGYYDEHAKNHHDALANLNRVMADLVDIGPQDRVLDAGCGQGGSAAWLAEQRGSRVVGITPVASQVRLAQAFLQKRGVSDQVGIELGDYTATTFPDASFDVVWACESLCHAPDKLLFYHEAFRILRPGGRLVIAEYIRASDQPTALQRLRDWLNGWAIPALDSRAEHLYHARCAGFDAIALQDVTANVAPSLRTLYLLANILRPVEYSLRYLRVRRRYQHGNIVGSLNLYRALQHGDWFYGLLNARKPVHTSL